MTIAGIPRAARAWLLPLTLLSVLAPTRAAARADEREQARTHFERGSAAYVLGHYADAATEYERAYELAPDAALLFDAAQAHRHAGHVAEALVLYRSYVRSYGDDPNAASARARIVELERAQMTGTAQSVRAEPLAPPSPPPPPRPPMPTPMAAPPQRALVAGTATTAPAEKGRHKRWWLWTGAGVAVAAGAGITLGVVLGRPREPAYVVKVP